MDTQKWQAVIDYYEACWTAFSPQVLWMIFADDILFNKVQGKEAVIQLFKDKFFKRVDISKTKISEFSLKPADNGVVVSYRISQTTKDNVVEDLSFIEEFTIKDEKISAICRTPDSRWRPNDVKETARVDSQLAAAQLSLPKLPGEDEEEDSDGEFTYGWL